ncbi:MAG: hypothetical protein ACC628_23815 [Pirellulaceae bacterium]
MTRTVVGWIGSLCVCFGLLGLNGCGNPSTEPPPESDSVTTEDLDIELPSFDTEGTEEPEGEAGTETSGESESS